MKKLFVVLSIVFAAVNSQAFKEKDVNFMGGVGLFGSRGVVGFSADRFYTENHALSVAFGADFVGAISTVGYKYFGGKMNNSGSVWDKCFFLIDCDIHNYGGVSLQYGGASKVTITEANDRREYDVDSKVLGLAIVGSRDVFKNGVTLDLELSYRSIMSGGKAKQVSGGIEDDTKALQAGYHDLGANVALGYMF